MARTFRRGVGSGVTGRFGPSLVRGFRRSVERGLSERGHFGIGQFAPLTGAQMPVLQRSDRDAPQFVDRVADGLEHLAHLPIPPFRYRDAQRGVFIVACRRDLHERALRAASVDGDASREAFDVACVRDAEHAHLVDTWHFVTWMRKSGGKFAVVGQQQQTLGVEVEPAHGVDVLADAREQLHDRGTTLWVGPGGDVPFGFVQEKIAVSFDALDPAPVDANVVSNRIGFRSELAHRGTVDGHAPFEHQLLGGASRRDAGLR